MEEARKKLFEKAIKRFTINDLVKHQAIGSGQKNLVELISRYPNFGQGFKVYKKTWPENCYYKLTNVHLFVSTLVRVCLLLFFRAGASDNFKA